VAARNNTENQEEQNVLVMFTNEEIMHFKAITELARVRLEQRDKAQKQASEREKRRIEATKRTAALEAARKKTPSPATTQL